MSKEQKAEPSPRQDTRPEPGSYSASDHKRWEAQGLDRIEQAGEMQYVNQEDDGPDQLRGEWFIADDDTRTIIWGSFGNYNSPGASGYTWAEVYQFDEEYRSALEVWEEAPEYLEGDDIVHFRRCRECDSELVDGECLACVPEEPEEGDYITQDHRHFYQYGKLVVTVSEGEDWQEAVRLYMIAEKYFTNVWFISDHGNAHLLEVC